jgi:cytochrome c-type protein NapC
MGSALTPFGALALGAAAIAAGILLQFLVARPVLTPTVRMRLLLGLAVFPFIAAVASTGSGMHRTTEPTFCGSCHVMETHLSDLEDPKSLGLAARHSRSPIIGPTACYTCHADYGMLGYPLTKLTGMMHVYRYYLGGFRSWSLEKFHAEVRTAKPYPNTNCQQCHSGTLASFTNVKEHLSLSDELHQNSVSCASAGCHGVAHPFSKTAEELNR